MQDTTLGARIAELRKNKGMTQRDLAEKMHITDKAVSKWERNVSRPDIDSIPLLAETLGISIDELVQCTSSAPIRTRNGIVRTVRTVLKSMGLAMGVATVALSALDVLNPNDGIVLLDIGLACVGLAVLSRADE